MPRYKEACQGCEHIDKGSDSPICITCKKLNPNSLLDKFKGVIMPIVEAEADELECDGCQHEKKRGSEYPCNKCSRFDNGDSDMFEEPESRVACEVPQETYSKPEYHESFVKDLDEVLAKVREMLITKNRKYGDSALNPKRIFSKASTLEQLHVRIDDKLSRIENRQNDEDEDVVNDLLGYLVIREIFLLRAEE